MISVELQGGLGNQLFQLAFLDYICNLNNAKPFLNKSTFSPHSRINYFDTIFQNWKPTQRQALIHKTIYEPQNNWRLYLPLFSNVQFVGFFQHYKYVLPNFVSKLDFSCSIHVLQKYPEIEKCVFLHIRGGDYLYPENKDYIFDTNTYYEKAISIFPTDTKFVIFTNDKPYAEIQPFLNRVEHKFIDENELNSLFLMSKCAGGICANSTFSWWGAYLNPNRTLILPSTWTLNANIDTSGYYFKGSISI